MNHIDSQSSAREEIVRQRATAALRNLFVADALAMPVHWFYNVHDIEKTFPGGVRTFHDAPAHHPTSIMSLHATDRGGRGGQRAGRQIVGDVILRGRRSRWGRQGCHYHDGMKAGENTLNAHCARLVMRSLTDGDGRWDRDRFLADYIDFMTADPPRHPDTYAESFHRGFFANREAGRAPARCGAVTHDTPSIGGLVMIAPTVLGERLRGVPLEDVQSHCREQLFLTHPDEGLARVCADYVALVDALLFRESEDAGDAVRLLADRTRRTAGVDVAELAARSHDDRDVIGSRFSSACYIDGAWPGVLYLACRYAGRPLDALQSNAELGGDNVHRGAVLGVLLGLMDGEGLTGLYQQLADVRELDREIQGLVGSVAS